MKVTIEKEYSVQDGVNILADCLKLKDLVLSDVSSLEVVYNEKKEKKCVIDRKSGAVVYPHGEVFESFMSLLAELVPEMDGKDSWKMPDWKPVSVYGNPPVSGNGQEYFMCTLDMDGDRCVKPCWFGSGHWHYGLKEIDDYVIAYMPNKKPYNGMPY